MAAESPYDGGAPETLEAARVVLEETQRALAEVESLADIGHWTWDIESDEVTWSDHLHEMWGVDPDGFEASYDDYLELLHPEDRAVAIAAVERSLETGESFEFEHRIVRDGETRYIYSRGRTSLDVDGNAVRMAGTAQDVTRQKELEQLRHQAARTEERHQQALELNDDVMQRLSAAWLALESGDLDVARDRLEIGLEALRRVISELFSDSRRTGPLEPGGLVRTRPSSPHSENG